MTRPHEHWKVMPHGKLAPVDEGILTVEGRIHMPLVNLPRRMTVVRLRDSRLVIWSAIALDEANRSGRIKAGDYVLMVVFGGGLTWAGSVIEW